MWPNNHDYEYVCNFIDLGYTMREKVKAMASDLFTTSKAYTTDSQRQLQRTTRWMRTTPPTKRPNPPLSESNDVPSSANLERTTTGTRWRWIHYLFTWFTILQPHIAFIPIEKTLRGPHWLWPNGWHFEMPQIAHHIKSITKVKLLTSLAEMRISQKKPRTYVSKVENCNANQ